MHESLSMVILKSIRGWEGRESGTTGTYLLSMASRTALLFIYLPISLTWENAFLIINLHKETFTCFFRGATLPQWIICCLHLPQVRSSHYGTIFMRALSTKFYVGCSSVISIQYLIPKQRVTGLLNLTISIVLGPLVSEIRRIRICCEEKKIEFYSRWESIEEKKHKQ